jgi:hypothetical protein
MSLFPPVAQCGGGAADYCERPWALPFLPQPVPHFSWKLAKETRRVDVGKALSHDIVSGARSDEAAEAEIDRFISKRSKALKAENRERREEEAWAESTKKINAAREAELKAAWCEYHQEQGRRHRAVLEALATHHEQRAEELMGGGDAA